MAGTVIDEILERLQATQREFDREVDRLLTESREQFRYSLRYGKVVFAHSARLLHLRHRTGIWQYLRQAPIAYLLSAPLIYGMIVPLAILDISFTLFQQICFRVYGIPQVRRSDYLVIDRHRLAYLNWIEKLNCVYCEYGNQLLEYVREVAGRTEQYWCPIKHARRTLDPHWRTRQFCEYGDAQAYRETIVSLRKDWGND